MSNLQHCCRARYYQSIFGVEMWDLVSSILPSADLTILVFSYLPDDMQHRLNRQILCNISNWWTVTVYWNIADVREENVTSRWVMERTDRYELAAWFWNAAGVIQNDIFKKLQYELVSDIIRDGKVRMVQSHFDCIMVEDLIVPLVIPEYWDEHQYNWHHHRLYFDNESSDSDD